MGNQYLTVWTLLAIWPLVLGLKTNNQKTEVDYIDSHVHSIVHGKMEVPSIIATQPWFQHEDYPASRFEKDIASTPVTHGIFMETAMDWESELNYLLNESCSHDSMIGIVAGFPLDDPAFEKLLDKYVVGRSKQILVGVRNWVKPVPEFYATQSKLWPALKIMEKRGLTLDIMVRANQYTNFTIIPVMFPRLKIIIDHMGVPYDTPNMMEEWLNGTREIAQFKNVYMKLSGIMTEVDLDVLFRGKRDRTNLTAPRYELFQPLVKHLIDVFGVDRCLFASMWPVHLVAYHSYTELYELADKLVDYLTPMEKRKLFGLNAVKIYGLSREISPCEKDGAGRSSSSQQVALILLILQVIWFWERSN